VYWSETRLGEQVIGGNAALADMDGAAGLAAHVRRCDAVIVCGKGTITIETADNQPIAPSTVSDEREATEASQGTAEEQPPAGDRPQTPAVRIDHSEPASRRMRKLHRRQTAAPADLPVAPESA
jgi:hypothetical protein